MMVQPSLGVDYCHTHYSDTLSTLYACFSLSHSLAGLLCAAFKLDNHFATQGSETGLDRSGKIREGHSMYCLYPRRCSDSNLLPCQKKTAMSR
jgi:hypothetical protein